MEWNILKHLDLMVAAFSIWGSYRAQGIYSKGNINSKSFSSGGVCAVRCFTLFSVYFVLMAHSIQYIFAESVTELHIIWIRLKKWSTRFCQDLAFCFDVGNWCWKHRELVYCLLWDAWIYVFPSHCFPRVMKINTLTEIRSIELSIFVTCLDPVFSAIMMPP